MNNACSGTGGGMISGSYKEGEGMCVCVCVVVGDDKWELQGGCGCGGWG